MGSKSIQIRGATNEESNLDDGFAGRTYIAGFDGARYSPLFEDALHVVTRGNAQLIPGPKIGDIFHAIKFPAPLGRSCLNRV